MLATRVRNRLGRLRWYGWRHHSDLSTAAPIIIGGSPRSGTTLLRRLLDSHPRIVCGPESSILLPGAPPVALLAHGYGQHPADVSRLAHESRSQTRFIEAFFTEHCHRVGKPRWSEKTPLNVAHIAWLWRHFPKARFVHVIRDGRDVVCSMRRHPDRRLVDGRMVELPRRSVDSASDARRWVTSTAQGLRHRADPRYREVRYEELVKRPDEVMAQLLAWLDEPFEASILAERASAAGPTRYGEEWDARAAIEASSVGRWRTDLSPADLAAVKREAGQRLIELGYTDGNDW